MYTILRFVYESMRVHYAIDGCLNFTCVRASVRVQRYHDNDTDSLLIWISISPSLHQTIYNFLFLFDGHHRQPFPEKCITFNLFNSGNGTQTISRTHRQASMYPSNYV